MTAPVSRIFWLNTHAVGWSGGAMSMIYGVFGLVLREPWNFLAVKPSCLVYCPWLFCFLLDPLPSLKTQTEMESKHSLHCSTSSFSDLLLNITTLLLWINVSDKTRCEDNYKISHEPLNSENSHTCSWKSTYSWGFSFSAFFHLLSHSHYHIVSIRSKPVAPPLYSPILLFCTMLSRL